MNRECIQVQVRTDARPFPVLWMWGRPWPWLWNPAQLSCEGHASVRHPQVPVCISVKGEQEPETIRIPSRVSGFPLLLTDRVLAQILLIFSATCLFGSSRNTAATALVQSGSLVHTETTADKGQVQRIETDTVRWALGRRRRQERRRGQCRKGPEATWQLCAPGK